MRSSFFCLSIMLLSCGRALAADPTVVPSPDINPDRFGWQGVYVGISGGYAKLTDVDNSFAPPVHDGGKDWIVGGYGGYLAQFGNLVVGAEVDANRLDIDYDLYSFITVNNSYVVKGRAGYAFDRFLVSGHAGGVYVTTNYLGLKDWGWEAGVGIDYALTDHLTVGGDYSHYGFNDFDGTEIDAKVNLVTARVGYKF